MWKSALGYFTAGAGSVAGNNEMIGSVLELGNMSLRVRRIIAEGGFAVVFEATDLATNRSCAVKRLIGHDAEKRAEIEQEIKFMKLLSGHPNVVKFITAASSKNEQNGSTEYLVVMEYCPKGRLTDLIGYKQKLSIEEVIRYFYQIARSVQHMHCQDPPICHRDLKLENVLIDGRERLKLCDFGSATTIMHYPDYSWSALRRSQVEDEIITHTTPMYRTPEMLDLYQNFPINQQQDIWALGCTLYLLCFGIHPFEDSAKLRILNANYTLEGKDPQYEVLHDLIHGCLKVDPRDRPTINDVVMRVEEIAEALGINLALLLKKSANNSPSHVPPSPLRNIPADIGPGRPLKPNQAAPTASSDGAMLNNFKSGASSFLQNMKDASNKMVESVASYAKGDLDISYLTSRLIVMSYPGEGIQGAVRNNIEDVRNFLESKHSQKYAVYNLTLNPYKAAKFSNRVSDCGWPSRKSPGLANLLTICRNMHQWLKLDASNVCVIHCNDGKAQSALVVSAFLAYCNVYQTTGPSLHLFTLRRGQPSLIPSHTRYIEYVSDICSTSAKCQPVRPHSRKLRLHSLTMQPVPMINSQKTGVKPFAEIYVNEERVFTSSQEYENIPGFDIRDDCAAIPLNLEVKGDITFVVYHARSLLGGKVQAKNISLKMFQFQFHTGFVLESSVKLKFARHDLDYLEAPDRYPDMFLASIQYEMLPDESEESLRLSSMTCEGASPYLVVKDDHELNELYRLVGPPEEKCHRAHEDSFDFESYPQDVPPPTPPSIPGAPSATDEPHSNSNPFQNEIPSISQPTNSVISDLLDLSVEDGSDKNGITRSKSPFDDSFVVPESFTDPFTSSAPVRDTDPLDLFATQDAFQTNPNTQSDNSTLFDCPQNEKVATKSSDPFSQAPDLLGDWLTDVNQKQRSAPKFEPPLDLFGSGFLSQPSSGNWNQSTSKNASASTSQHSQQQTTSSNFQNLDPFGGAFQQMGASSQTNTPQRSRSPNSDVKQNNTRPRSVSPYPTKPNYNVNMPPPQQHNRTGIPKKIDRNAGFADLLGDFTVSGNGDQTGAKKSMKEMKKEQLLDSGALDADELKIREWTEGKEGNIRALLCSLHKVLWTEARWKECGMHQLVSPGDVEKMRKKALIAVHPDKQLNTPNEKLSKLITMELNESWNQYQSSGAQSLYGNS